MKRTSKLSLFVLITLSLCLPAALAHKLVPQGAGPRQGGPPFDLSGIWQTSDGDTVEVLHGGSNLIAIFRGKSECPNGDRRTFFIKGTFQGTTLQGTMARCTRDPHLVEKCGLKPVYTTTFKATVTQDEITGTYRSEYYAPASGECEYKRDSSGDKDIDFSLTRACDPDKRKLCNALAGAIQRVDASIKASPSAANLQSLQQSLQAQLDQIRDQLCEDADAQDKIDKISADLASLDPAKATTIAERRKVSRIALDLEGIKNASCSSAGQSNNPNSCGPGAPEKAPGDEAAIDQVIGGIKDAIKQLEDTAREIEGAGSSAAYQLDEIRTKIGKLKQYQGYWNQIKAAKCLPPEIPQLIRRLADEKRAGFDTGATCAELCAKSADWIVQLTGDPRQKKFVFEACFAYCF